MPAATRDTKYHANRKENAPYSNLDEDVEPEDGVDGSGGCLLGKFALVLVRAHCVEKKEERKKKMVGVPGHGDNEGLQ